MAMMSWLYSPHEDHGGRQIQGPVPQDTR
jgi:hypothetical protein